jgi:hypothetical protein
MSWTSICRTYATSIGETAENCVDPYWNTTSPKIQFARLDVQISIHGDILGSGVSLPTEAEGKVVTEQ